MMTMNHDTSAVADRIVTGIKKLANQDERLLENIEKLSLLTVTAQYVSGKELTNKNSTEKPRDVIIVKSMKHGDLEPVFVAYASEEIDAYRVITFERGDWETALLERYLPGALDYEPKEDYYLGQPEETEELPIAFADLKGGK